MIINHLGISGGKDSTALLLWAVHESGYPLESIRATFCDTGNEADETLDFVRMLSESVHPIEWIKPPLDYFELVQKKGMFPSPRIRYCTQLLKLEPTKVHLYKMLEEGHEILCHTGVRASESHARASLDEHGFDEYMGLPVFRPLLRWSIADVWAIHKRYGIEPNPLYAKGAKRVGCLPCMMSQKREIRRTAENWPEKIDKIREAEAKASGGRATFFAKDKIPIRFRTKEITTTSGVVMNVASIDDVVRWSHTGYRAEETPELFEFEEEPSSCSHTSGACE